MPKLYKHQQEFVDRNPDRFLLAWETGTGKTFTAIAWANDGIGNVLVICPKTLKENWKRNIQQAGDPTWKWQVMTKEEFKRDHQKLGRIGQVIVDEAHYFANYKSQMGKDLSAFLKEQEVPRILLLTATPMLSTPWNVYTLVSYIEQMNWMAFNRTFFYDVRMGGRSIPKVRPHMESKLKEVLLRHGSTVRLEDCVDMPDSVIEEEWFTLTEEQREAIKDSWDPLPIVRYSKEHQICGGTMKGDGYVPTRRMGSPKLDRLQEIARDVPRVVVVCKYTEEIDALVDALRDQGLPVESMTGATTDRDGIIERLKQQERYVFVVQAQISEGWELPACEMMVFYSLDWSLKNWVQAQGRIRRITHPERRVYRVLLCRDSVDEAVWDALSDKRDFQTELYAVEKYNADYEA